MFHNKPRCLVVGNYCHDVLIKDDVIIAESLGGAASFISAVLDGLNISAHYVSKVGSDFAYKSVNHQPIQSTSSKTTTFHAFFSSKFVTQDRILKRVVSCDPIYPRDLPEGPFHYGLAVGVGGEILPETLGKMIEICKYVFVDIQALIREFECEDGTVMLVPLKDSGFYHLVPKLAVIKASGEEARFLDVEEVRNRCCVVVTNGKQGCKVCWKDNEEVILPFSTIQVDPTGAGDSFLGGLVGGVVQGFSVPDAALLGNLFGSLTVAHIGFANFDSKLLQRVKDEAQATTNHQQTHSLQFFKSASHQQFHAALSAARITTLQPK
ncbi:hypothetical protein Leryth_004214 [Lithospermum erythrorhizon]|nr:hypothetical protein Leryth_004214 [Lithospermum erythrorhizon]